VNFLLGFIQPVQPGDEIGTGRLQGSRIGFAQSDFEHSLGLFDQLAAEVGHPLNAGGSGHELFFNLVGRFRGRFAIGIEQREEAAQREASGPAIAEQFPEAAPKAAK
jgi:hypothetical protein